METKYRIIIKGELNIAKEIIEKNGGKIIRAMENIRKQETFLDVEIEEEKLKAITNLELGESLKAPFEEGMILHYRKIGENK